MLLRELDALNYLLTYLGTQVSYTVIFSIKSDSTWIPDGHWDLKVTLQRGKKDAHKIEPC